MKLFLIFQSHRLTRDANITPGYNSIICFNFFGARSLLSVACTYNKRVSVCAPLAHVYVDVGARVRGPFSQSG